MKKNEAMSITSADVIAGKKKYVSPRVTYVNIKMEHGIAAGSVQNSINSSWSTEDQSQDIEFQP